ncbi:E3 ubiquitin-protein ligase SHPRH [Chloropicon primus]|nr:E3 ubiquitin-protein ligase SHPRH [Chloropicon primus]
MVRTLKRSAPVRRRVAPDAEGKEVVDAVPASRKRKASRAPADAQETEERFVATFPEKDEPGTSSFELARQEVEVELSARGDGGEAASTSERSACGDGRYALELLVKPNRLYKRKKLSGDTTCLQCVLSDRAEGTSGVCTISNFAGSHNEVRSLVQSLGQGLLRLRDIRLDECSTSASRKRLGFSIALWEEAFALRPSFAYDKPRRNQVARASLLRSALKFVRPDFFSVGRGPETRAAAAAAMEASLGTAGKPKDHLELAMHTVGQGGEQINTALLYAAIAPQSQEAGSSKGDERVDSIQGLVPTLRAYQKRAVSWMLEREESFGEPQEGSFIWKKCGDLGGREEAYLNVYTGQVSRQAYPAEIRVPGGILADEMGLGKTVEVLACILSNRCPGGVKKEEGDGVGGEKVAASLVGKLEAEDRFAHGSDGQYDGAASMTWVSCDDCRAWIELKETGYKSQADVPSKYICGECVRNRAKDASLLHEQCKTTLIICPDPILEQWEEELEKHTHHGFLRIFTYSGQKASLSTGGNPDDVVTAQVLSEYDVVLSTYSVLGADIHKDADIVDTLEENQKSLRYAKRYQKVPTPLTRLKWWRVCLDEAQMVQSGTAKCAQMALKLATKFRWCVTGTPINKGLEDLYGLMMFLQAHPFDYRYWWNMLVQNSCELGSTQGFSNLTGLLQPSSGGIMWRTRKVDVKEDLNLQPQLVKITNLDLSAVERHFYKQQHQECYDVAVAALPRGVMLSKSTSEDEERTLGPRAASKVFAKLLRLRQACCHPQVGSQGIRALSQSSKPLSMEEILDMMIEKAKVDAEDTLRIVIFCLNGLASIFQLEGSKKDAVLAYREALQYSGNHVQYGIKTDSLQKLHTLHNLSSLLLQGSIAGIAPTLRDSQLGAEAKALKKDYLRNASSRLILANTDFLARKDKVAYSEGQKFGMNWWIEILTQIERDGDSATSRQFLDQIKSRLSDRTAVGTSMHGRNSSSLVHRFDSIGGLKYLLSVELRSIFDAREEAIKELSKLESECQKESPSFIYEVSRCGKCRGELGTSLVHCAYCSLDDLLMRYEARIFSLRTQATKKGTILNAEDATRAQESAGGFAGGWGRMAGRSVQGDSGARREQDTADLGRGARGRTGKTVAHADVFHAPSEAEVILDYLASVASKGKFRNLSLSKSKGFEQLVKDHLLLLENMRNEFKPARAYALAQRQYVYSFDELEMAMMKMQLRAEGEELLHDHEKYFKLYRSELVVRNKELSDEKIVAQADLTRAVGTLRYLEGLAAAKRRSRQGLARGEEPDEDSMCLVCQEGITGNTAVLSCGHFFCSKCVTALIARSRPGPGGRRTREDLRRRKILCPTCRSSIFVSEIAYAGDDRLTQDQEENDEDRDEAKAAGGAGVDEEFDLEGVRVKGSFGSKLEAVVRRVASILHRDPEAKILVFSEWQDVLELLTHAFNANQVPFVFAKGKPAMSKALKQFKTKREVAGAVASVLMLPVKLGANGLNLIEAQHVVLIEPLLDPAKEAQAFGRVDRIGQTKKTYVHRFIVRRTVEEKVYALAQQRASAYSIMGFPATRTKEGVSEMSSLTIADIKSLILRGQCHDDD